MHRNWTKAAFLALALGAALPAMAETRRYVYYDHDIYYAPYSHTYYWRENGDWRSGHTIARRYRTYVRGHGFEIDLDTDRPYDRHDYVIAQYRERHHHHDRDHDHDHDHDH